MNQPAQIPPGPETLSDLIALVGPDPSAFEPSVWLAEVRDTGASGASLGSFPLHPVDSFEDRLREAFGAPLRVHARVRKVGSHHIFKVFLCELAPPRSAPAHVAPPPAAPAPAAWMPTDKSLVTSDPLQGAMGIMRLASEWGDMMESRVSKVIASAARPPAGELTGSSVEAIAQLAREAAQKENPWTAALAVLAPAASHVIAGIGEGLAARAALMRAHAGRIAVAPTAEAPPAEAPPAEAPPAEAPPAEAPPAEAPPAEVEPDGETGKAKRRRSA